MRLLLDTHVALWCLSDDPKLTAQARTWIQDAQSVHVSVASLWEIVIKRTTGKLALDVPNRILLQALKDSGFAVLDIFAEHTLQAAELPPIHRDPFDRMLVAQSLCEPLRLLTCDAVVAQYNETIILL